MCNFWNFGPWPTKLVVKQSAKAHGPLVLHITKFGRSQIWTDHYIQNVDFSYNLELNLFQSSLKKNSPGGFLKVLSLGIDLSQEF